MFTQPKFDGQGFYPATIWNLGGWDAYDQPIQGEGYHRVSKTLHVSRPQKFAQIVDVIA